MTCPMLQEVLQCLVQCSRKFNDSFHFEQERQRNGQHHEALHTKKTRQIKKKRKGTTHLARLHVYGTLCFCTQQTDILRRCCIELPQHLTCLDTSRCCDSAARSAPWGVGNSASPIPCFPCLPPTSALSTPTPLNPPPPALLLPLLVLLSPKMPPPTLSPAPPPPPPPVPPMRRTAASAAEAREAVTWEGPGRWDSRRCRIDGGGGGTAWLRMLPLLLRRGIEAEVLGIGCCAME
eukprot:314688-Pelagomonas_calceolata.AAC.2